VTDFAADNYYARCDGTEDAEPEGDDLTPLAAALDRTEAAVTTFAPLTDTDAALTRIQAIARLGGIVLHVTEHWAWCSCTTGTHPWMKRSDRATDAEACARDVGGRWHVVRNHRLDGYTAWETTP